MIEGKEREISHVLDYFMENSSTEKWEEERTWESSKKAKTRWSWIPDHVPLVIQCVCSLLLWVAYIVSLFCLYLKGYKIHFFFKYIDQTSGHSTINNNSWMLQFCLIEKLLWPIVVYEILCLTVGKLESQVNSYTWKWLGSHNAWQT